MSRVRQIYPWWGGGGVTVNAVLGTLSDPVTGSTINTNSWFLPQTYPVDCILSQIKIYCVATGTVKLKIAQPIKGGGFNITDVQTFTISSTGLKTFSVAAGTLTPTVIPANSMIGIRASAAGIVTYNATAGMGYIASASDVSGNGVVLPLTGVGFDFQIQCTVSYTRSAITNLSFVDEDFSSAVQPAYGFNYGTAWTFPGGKIRSGATGLANRFYFYPDVTTDKVTSYIDFEFLASGDRVAILRMPTNFSQGFIGEADLNNNKIIIYEQWDSANNTLPSINTSLTLSSLTLAIGVRYRLTVTKNSTVINLTVTRLSDSIGQTLASIGTITFPCHGKIGVVALAGTIDVFAAKMYTPSTINPKSVLFGDSVTAGAYGGGAGNYNNGYAQLFLNQAGGNGWFCGQPGGTSGTCLVMVRHTLRLSTPSYVVIFIGINNAGSDPNVTLWNTETQTIYDYILSRGSTPIFCTVTPRNDSAPNNARVATMNTTLLARTSWRFSRFDLAISLNNDGITYNAANMQDTVHPNTIGHPILTARLLLDQPQIF